MFISVEGPDYSGKTTQVGVIKDYYESLGKKVLVSKEPGGTEVGMKIREILVQEDIEKDPLSVTTQLLLLFAARVHHVDKVILPALQRGEVVVCDRYIDSTYAYQGLMYNHRHVIEKLLEVPKLKHLRVRPDYTFYYDIDFDTMMSRMAARGMGNSLDVKYAKLKDLPINAFRHHFDGLVKTIPESVKWVDGCTDIKSVSEATVGLCRAVLRHFDRAQSVYLHKVMDLKSQSY